MRCFSKGVAVGIPVLCRDAISCPFCDLGARDTAYFILALFGFFVAGMSAIFFIFLKKGGWNRDSDLGNKVLEIEKGCEDDGFRS